jgi:hypothetical protein
MFAFRSPSSHRFLRNACGRLGPHCVAAVRNRRRTLYGGDGSVSRSVIVNCHKVMSRLIVTKSPEPDRPRRRRGERKAPKPRLAEPVSPFEGASGGSPVRRLCSALILSLLRHGAAERFFPPDEGIASIAAATGLLDRGAPRRPLSRRPPRHGSRPRRPRTIRLAIHGRDLISPFEASGLALTSWGAAPALALLRLLGCG